MLLQDIPEFPVRFYIYSSMLFVKQFRLLIDMNRTDI